MPGRLLRRFAFTCGLATGATVVVAGVVVGASVGAVDTDKLYPPLEHQIRVWDTRGSDDPDRWHILTVGRHAVPDARRVYIETDNVRVRFGGDPSTSTTWVAQPLDRRTTRLPAIPRASGTDPALPVVVDEPNNQLADLRVGTGSGTYRVKVGALHHGFTVQVPKSADARRFDLLAFRGRWAVSTEAGGAAAGHTGTDRDRSVALAPLETTILTVEGGRWDIALVASQPANLVIRTDAVGRMRTAHVVLPAGVATSLYVAPIAGHGLVERSSRITATAGARYLVGRWAGRKPQYEVVVPPVSAFSVDPPSDGFAVVHRLDGEDGLDAIRAEAMSAYGFG